LVQAHSLANVKQTKNLIRRVVPRIPETRECECARVLVKAIIKQPNLIPKVKKRDLDLLIGKYLKWRSEKSENICSVSIWATILVSF
jgi:hypothetical protein